MIWGMTTSTFTQVHVVLPFAVAQLVVLGLFIALTIVATKEARS